MFKKLLCLSISLCIIVCSLGKTRIVVDERFELISVAFRLTGEPAFVQDVPNQYINEIDTWFSKYRDHPFISFLNKQMDVKKNVAMSYSAVLASDIEITPKGIILSQKTETDYESNSYGYNWTAEERDRFLLLINSFYKKSRFHDFFAAHSTYYKTMESQMSELINLIDTNWFNNFFGSSYQLDYVWIVPSGGVNNYALPIKYKSGHTAHSVVIGCSMQDSNGSPIFDESDFRVLIHEICHLYNNPICSRHLNEFESICDTLFYYVGDILAENYYGYPSSILYEGFNRLCEFSYYKSHGKTFSWIQLRVGIEERKGFIWFDDMLAFFSAFEDNRNTYKYFEDFLPQLKSFLDQLSKDMQLYYNRFEDKFPQVTFTFPSQGSIVNPNIDCIEIHFSKPMYPLIWYIPVEGTEKLPTDEKNKNGFWKDEYTYVYKLPSRLKPHTKYGFGVDDWLQSTERELRYHAKNFTLIFETE